MTYEQWAERYPGAAQALLQVIAPTEQHVVDADGTTEAWAQQRVRMQVARQGSMAWRNNVGATPANCRACGAPQQPVRYGLANDSHALNKQIKSSDLICAIRRRVVPEMVGTTIAQFGSIECKRPGWTFTGRGEEAGQAAWLALVARLGGYATFSTGEAQL